MRRNKFCYIALLLFTINFYFPQGNTNLVQITPPSMDSYKLGIYGNIPVGLFTGSPNYQIPITSLKLSGFEVPVSLTYTVNGIKVDEPNGNVGLGWTLNAGGVISVLIRDLDDNLGRRLQVPDIDNTPFTILKPTLILSEQEQYDSESDLYIANVNGISFKFIIKDDGEVLMFSQEDLKIEGGGGFTDKNGVQYILEAVEITQTRRPPGQPGPTQRLDSAFYLTKIILPTSEVINLTYNDKIYTTNVFQNQIMKITPMGQLQYRCIGVLDFNAGVIEERVFTTQTVNKKQLQSIKSSNGEEIDFLYGSDTWAEPATLIGITKKISDSIIENYTFSYLETSNNRKFLKKITDLKKQSFYEFQYIEPQQLPLRFNFGQDIWGFYNGKTNSNLIPKDFPYLQDGTFSDYGGADRSINAILGSYGLLKKIIYPTKGFTEISYERNTTPGTVVDTPVQENVVTKNIDINEENIFVLNPTKNEYIKIAASSFFDQDHCTTPSQHQSNLSVKNANNQPVQLYTFGINGGYMPYNFTVIPSNSLITLYVKAIKGQIINFEISTTRPCTIASAVIYYTNVTRDGTTTKGNMLSEGYRVSEVTETPDNQLTPIIKKFNYNDSNNLSNGIQLTNPYFLSITTFDDDCYPEYTIGNHILVHYYVVNSANINSAFRTHANFFYSKVDEYITGKGKTSHFYTTNSDIYGRSEWGNNILNSTMSNTGWNNGRESKTSYFDNDNNRLKEVENIYVENESKNKVYYDLITKKNYEPVIRVTGNIDHLDIMSYKNISHNDYLESQKTTDFLDGKPLITTTQYFYDNPLHYQPTSQKTTFPDLTTQQSYYGYAQEIGNQKLINANMVGIPLRTEIQKNGKMISKNETRYDNPANLLPSSALTYNLQSNAAIIDIVYDFYDNKGNLLQYTTKSGISTIIIWGYNQTKPIAKVEGATYPGQVANRSTDVLQSLITAIVDASDLDASDPTKEGDFIIALNNFRKDLTLKNYHITTYTYNPLIGVTSITPPSGIRETYIYDTANRLQYVKDVNDTILKEYEYHYKP